MRLTPNDFQATAEHPFQNDRLNREPQVNGLCNIIEAVQGHAVVSIDGSWGSGKTAFVKMCSAQLAKESVAVVDFNAWQESYTNTPLVDLVSAISATLGNKGRLNSKLVSVAWHIANVASKGLIDRDALENGESTTFDAWAEADKKVRTFQHELSKLVPSDKDDVPAKLVVIIDELDRCRPDYALRLIETVRHLFAVDGVLVLLAINREELCHSVHSIYGSDFDSDRYLRRFVDVALTLPPPGPNDLSNFTADLLVGLNLDRWFSTDPNLVATMLQKIATAVRHNLRDLQQAIHLAAIATESKQLQSFDFGATSQRLLALVILKTLDKKAYLDLTYGDGDAFAAVASMNKSLSTEPPTLVDRYTDSFHLKIEACLLGGALTDLSVNRPGNSSASGTPEQPGVEDTFKKMYEDAFVSTFGEQPAVIESARERAATVLEQVIGQIPGRLGQPIDQLARIIDMIDY